MGNKYVRKGAAAEVAPPSAPSPAPARGPVSTAALRQEEQQQQQQQLDVRTVARPQGEEQLQHRSGSVQASVQASDFGPSEVLVSDE